MPSMPSPSLLWRGTAGGGARGDLPRGDHDGALRVGGGDRRAGRPAGGALRRRARDRRDGHPSCSRSSGERQSGSRSRTGSAFRLAAPAFRGERPTQLDTLIGLAQVGGAMFVAAVSSVPIIVLSDVRAQEFTGDVPAIIIGAIGYLLARRAGRAAAACGVLRPHRARARRAGRGGQERARRALTARLGDARVSARVRSRRRPRAARPR